MHREYNVVFGVGGGHLTSPLKDALRILPPTGAIDHESVQDTGGAQLWNDLLVAVGPSRRLPSAKPLIGDVDQHGLAMGVEDIFHLYPEIGGILKVGIFV